MTLRNADPTGAKAQGYPMDHSFEALASPGAVGHLQGGHRDVRKGRAPQLSLPCISCTLIQIDQESSLCFKVSANLCGLDKFRCCDVPPGRGRREPSAVV